jgi:muramoyltetrapeptide carboxypeptidase
MIASLARPPALRPGDRVAVLSASSPPDQERLAAILEAAARRLGWASLHGTMVSYFDTYEFASLLRTLMHPEQATSLCFAGARTVVAGVARGIMCGGNLTVLTASLGTDTSWPARGGVWLVEDEGEDDYRIDRMLTQLRRSGYLDRVAGIVAGTFQTAAASRTSRRSWPSGWARWAFP